MRFGIAEDVGGAEILALALSERALLAMAPPVEPGEALAARARTALRLAGIEESYATPLISAGKPERP
jgi:hypothetical protein